MNPDGSNQRSKFNVNRYIEYYANLHQIVSVIVTFSGACGIKDGDSLIITGGGWENPNGEITATKLVDRYNSKVNALIQFLYKKNH